VQRAESVAPTPRAIPITVILLVAFLVHAPFLAMEVPLRSYDTNFHIFFASHYAKHWFDPWNPKWYAGFSQTTYPPLPQQWLALFSHVIGLDMAYMLVQLIAILLLALGVYRFAKLWVDPRAASFAALASVFLGAEWTLVYTAGQLSTTFAAPLYLNALPYIYDWVRHSSWRSLLKGATLAVAAAAAHHATLLFGSFLLALPVFILALIDREDGKRISLVAFFSRSVFVTVLVGAAIAVVLLPFWIALLKYPVTQVPIPHASRANFLLSPEWSVSYFWVPYGAMLLAFPYILIKGTRVPRLRPLLFCFWLGFLLGLGGTTPLGHILLGRAFEVLTMERFTYWGSLLALPFIGLLAKEMIDRYRTRGIVALSLAAGLTIGLAAWWVTYHPADAVDFKVDSVAQWLNRDGHDKYRYITLGFGNKIARLAVLANPGSLDGEWNSGRMLPELTEHGAAALTSSKYFGKNGIDALTAILHHSDRYGLKWVIVRDSYYEPLLVFAGWRRVDDMDDRTITIWAKDDVPPATPVNAPQMPPAWQGLLWGTLPIGSSILALLLVLIPDRKLVQQPVLQPAADSDQRDLVLGRLIS
jgi:hypothetical protein